MPIMSQPIATWHPKYSSQKIYKSNQILLHLLGKVQDALGITCSLRYAHIIIAYSISPHIILAKSRNFILIISGYREWSNSDVPAFLDGLVQRGVVVCPTVDLV